MSENDSPRLYLRNAQLNTNFRTHDILQLTNKIQTPALDTMDTNIKSLCDSKMQQMKRKPQHQTTPTIRLNHCQQLQMHLASHERGRQLFCRRTM